MIRNAGFWKKSGKLILWVLVLALCVGMAERKFFSQRCEEIIIKFPDSESAGFLSRTDIVNHISREGPVLGRKMEHINLAEIEESVRSLTFVKNCEAQKDFSGNLILDVDLYAPIARWIDSPGHQDEWKKARGFYIDEEGHYIPLSNRFTIQVPLVSGEYIRKLNGLNSEKGKPYLDLIRYIQADDFWKAQISQIIVAPDGEVSFLTTLGDQLVEFGPPVQIPSKFRKLKIFYDRVLSKDWNTYSKINIKFQDQVVCE